jgi:proteasome lid subunit RPN8/RPN11
LSTLQQRAQSVIDVVEAHAFSDTRREVGGVLVGTFDDDSATITAALPALKATGRETNVTFTHEVWEDTLATVDRDYPSERIVGWYHTHPGFGLFLSEYDLFIHRNFFPDPRMLALVIDPLAGELGWFGWDGDNVILRERHTTTRSALGTVAAAQRATSTRRPRLGPSAVVAVPALVLLGAIGGYTLGSATHSADQGIRAERLTTARAAAQDARAQAERLQTQLDARRSQSATPSAALPATAVQYRVRAGDTFGKWRSPSTVTRGNTHASQQPTLGLAPCGFRSVNRSEFLSRGMPGLSADICGAARSTA